AAPPAARRRARPRSASAPPRGELDWAAAGWAGLSAGLLMILFETALSSLSAGASGTDPVRRIAAIALNRSVLPALSPFTGLVFLAAMSVHLPLSLLYARLLAPLVHGARAGRAVAIGVLFGAGLYALNYYALAGLFPWFAAARGWITLASHLLFGATAAGAYVLLSEPVRAEGRGRGQV
ncbi:MAG: hypothetical protein KGM24_14950, partial [Elusimicrobia bacterium]|nr:hypothetical protein [Elusimicrobiota bacterium]